MTTAAACSTKRSLSPARQALVELMQSIQFGSIEGLQITNGEPVLGPRSRVLREIVFGKENPAIPAGDKDDFTLKSQHVELFSELDREGSGTVEKLVIQNGLPVRMTVAAGPRAS